MTSRSCRAVGRIGASSALRLYRRPAITAGRTMRFPHHRFREEGRIRPLYGEVKPAPEPAAEPTAPYPMRPEDLPQLTLKQRREAKEERFKAEGFSEWSDFEFALRSSLGQSQFAEQERQIH